MNSFLNLIVSIFEFLQICLFFYAFLACFYWFMTIFNFTGCDFLEPYFKFMKKFVSGFYSYSKDSSGYDLTLIIIAGISLGLATLMSRTKEVLEDFLAVLRKLKKSHERSVSIVETKKLSEELNTNMEQYKQFLYCIKIEVTTTISDSMVELSFVNTVEDIKQCLMNDFISLLKTQMPFAKKVENDVCFFKFNNFQAIDNFLSILFNNKMNLIKKYARPYTKIDITEYIEPLKPETKINENKIFSILNFKISDKIITSTSFVTAYNCFPARKFNVESLGEYQVPGNGRMVVEEFFGIARKSYKRY